MDTWEREGMSWVHMDDKETELKRLSHLPFAAFRGWLNLNIIPHCDRDNVWLTDKLGWGHTNNISVGPCIHKGSLKREIERGGEREKRQLPLPHNHKVYPVYQG